MVLARSKRKEVWASAISLFLSVSVKKEEIAQAKTTTKPQIHSQIYCSRPLDYDADTEAE